MSDEQVEPTESEPLQAGRILGVHPYPQPEQAEPAAESAADEQEGADDE